MIAVSLVTVTILHSAIAGIVIWPWSIVAAEHSSTGILNELFLCFSDQRFWYVFIWLLPLGIWRLARLPKQWVMASLTAALTALALGIFASAQGHAARPMFDVAGPILSLSGAILITDFMAAISPEKGN